MTTIVTRTTVGSNTGKGSPLTHTEVDTNFVNLNTAKLETAAIPLGTLQAPSVSFLNDSDTGIFCPQGGNSLAIVTGGQYAITCSSTQAVGIKTANPQGALQVAGSTRIGANDATDAFLEIGEGATGNRNSYIDIVADTTYTDYGLRIIRNNTGANATSELKHRGTGALNFTTQEAAPIVFNTTNSPRLTILAGGNVGIGTSSPGQNITVQSSTSGTAPTFKLQNPVDSNSSQGAANNLSAGQLLFGATGAFPLTAKIESVYNADANFGRVAKLIISGANGGGTLTERVTIDEAGSVGIGSNSPGGTLDIKAAASTHPLIVQGPSSEFARVDSSGRLLIGTTTSNGGGGRIECISVNATSHALIVNQIEPTAGTTYKLISGYRGVFGVSAAETFIVFNNGNVQNTNNSYLGISDAKLKENIVDANSQWDDLKALQVRNYNFKEGQTHTQIGLVAQEVQLVSPGLVSESPDRDNEGNDLGTVTKSVNYSVLYMKAVKALQEAMERIETLEQRLTAAGID